MKILKLIILLLLFYEASAGNSLSIPTVKEFSKKELVDKAVEESRYELLDALITIECSDQNMKLPEPTILHWAVNKSDYKLVEYVVEKLIENNQLEAFSKKKVTQPIVITSLAAQKLTQLTCSPEGTKVCMKENDKYVVRKNDGTFIRELEDHVYAIKWHPDGEHICSFKIVKTNIDWRNAQTEATVWDLGQLSVKKNIPGYISDVSWNLSGKWICAIYANKGVKIFDSDSLLLLAAFREEKVESGYWSPDNNKMCLIGRTCIYLWDGKKFKILLEQSEPFGKESHEKSYPTIEWNVDGRRICTNVLQGVKLWDSDGMLLKELLPEKAGILVWSPDGKSLAGVGNGRLYLWSSDGILLAHSMTKMIIEDSKLKDELKIIWSPDGKQVCLVNFGGVAIGKLSTGLFKELDHKDVIIADWSPDSTWLITGSEKQIKLWNSDGVFLKVLFDATVYKYQEARGEYIYISSPSRRLIDNVLWSRDGSIIGINHLSKMIFWKRDGVFLGELEAHAVDKWSIDGSRIFCISEKKFLVIDVEGGTLLDWAVRSLCSGADSKIVDYLLSLREYEVINEKCSDSLLTQLLCAADASKMNQSRYELLCRTLELLSHKKGAPL